MMSYRNTRGGRDPTPGDAGSRLPAGSVSRDHRVESNSSGRVGEARTRELLDSLHGRERVFVAELIETLDARLLDGQSGGPRPLSPQEQAAELREAVEAFYREAGERPPSASDLGRRLKRQGIRSERGTGGARTYQGLSLRSDGSAGSDGDSVTPLHARAYGGVTESDVTDVTAVTPSLDEDLTPAGPRPLLGDPGYLQLLDHALAADVITAAERQRQRLVHLHVVRDLALAEPPLDEHTAIALIADTFGARVVAGGEPGGEPEPS